MRVVWCVRAYVRFGTGLTLLFYTRYNFDYPAINLEVCKATGFNSDAVYVVIFYGQIRHNNHRRRVLLAPL